MSDEERKIGRLEREIKRSLSDEEKAAIVETICSNEYQEHPRKRKRQIRKATHAARIKELLN